MEIGAYEAKTKLPELLRKVESTHEEVVITRFGHAIAKIVPITKEDWGIVATITAIKSLRRAMKKGKGAVSVKAMVEEGRRF